MDMQTLKLANEAWAKNAAIRIAVQAYRDALRAQARLPEDQRWTLDSTIKALKAAAYVEIESAQIRLRRA
jgi:hypothetical protein